jgi:hypothetical protein
VAGNKTRIQRKWSTIATNRNTLCYAPKANKKNWISIDATSVVYHNNNTITVLEKWLLQHDAFWIMSIISWACGGGRGGASDGSSSIPPGA